MANVVCLVSVGFVFIDSIKLEKAKDLFMYFGISKIRK